MESQRRHPNLLGSRGGSLEGGYCGWVLMDAQESLSSGKAARSWDQGLCAQGQQDLQRGWRAGRGLAEGAADVCLRHATWLSSSPALSGRVQVAFLGWDSARVQRTENYLEDFSCLLPTPHFGI